MNLKSFCKKSINGADKDRPICFHLDGQKPNSCECFPARSSSDTHDDIQYTPEQAKAILEEEKVAQGILPVSRRTALINDYNERWPHTIDYMFNEIINANKEAQEAIKGAMAIWQENTCMKFNHVTVAPPKPHLSFVSEDCSSAVGMSNAGAQRISIGKSCQTVPTAIHEIGHALGLYHEQSRHDRDDYVTINYHNIAPWVHRNFRQQENTEDLGLEYDYGSIMHYKTIDFSVNPKRLKRTIQPIDARYLNVMGQRIEMTFNDAKAINIGYDCVKRNCGNASLKGCKYGGYQDPNNCGQCRCPEGLTGRFCAHVKEGANAICGGVIDVTPGFFHSIQSPNYPEKVTAAARCYWLLKAPPGGKVAAVFEDDMPDFGAHWDGPCQSWVEIRQNSSDFGATGPRYCGTSYKNSATTVSSREEMLVSVYGSIYGERGTGFKLRFYVKDENTPDFTECLVTNEGAEYMGLKNTTSTGKVCDDWSLHADIATTDMPDKSLCDVGNKCRNPDGSKEKPWCYISGAKTELCDIPVCTTIHSYPMATTTPKPRTTSAIPTMSCTWLKGKIAKPSDGREPPNSFLKLCSGGEVRGVKSSLENYPERLNFGNAKSGYINCLTYAAAFNEAPLFQFLLKQPDIDVNAVNGKFYSPLYWATRFGHVEIARQLIEAGAMVNVFSGITVRPDGSCVAGKDLETTLDTAISRKKKQLVDLLISKGGKCWKYSSAGSGGSRHKDCPPGAAEQTGIESS